MKDSFIFYRSFYESAMELNQKDRLKFYDAIFELALNNNETELKGASKAVFIAIKPQIIANNTRYENGLKGGRKKKNQNETKTKPKSNQNETKEEPNENVNENVNENEYLNVNDNVFGLFETEFKRSLSSNELMKLSDWLEKYDEEAVTFALRSAIVQGVCDFNYIGRILEVQNHDDIEGEY